MAKLRYIGATSVEVVANGHPKGGHLGTVESDQILEVDDDVYKAQAWPESRWVVVEEPSEAVVSSKSKGGE